MKVIYAIRDPRDKRVYYIGSTIYSFERGNQHRAELLRGKHRNKRLQAWGTALLKQGYVPEYIVLEKCPHLPMYKLRELEHTYIHNLRKQGEPLLNGNKA